MFQSGLDGKHWFQSMLRVRDMVGVWDQVEKEGDTSDEGHSSNRDGHFSPSNGHHLLPQICPNMDPSAFSSLLLVTPFLKEFPIEIYNEILKFCDPSTLAALARVSLAFLELSSPLLYRNVELVGTRNMAKLFCGREVSFEVLVSLIGLEQLDFELIFPSAGPSLPASAPNLSSSKTFPSVRSDPAPSFFTLQVSTWTPTNPIVFLPLNPWRLTSSTSDSRVMAQEPLSLLSLQSLVRHLRDSPTSLSHASVHR